MNGAEQSTYTCPKCGTTSSKDAVAKNDYQCSSCALQLAHLDLAPNGSVRGVLGWLREPGCLLNNRYRVNRVLGCGGFAATYLAEDLLLPGKYRAIKEIPAPQYDTHEAALLSRLRHPAIPDISDRFETDGMIYLVLAFGGDRNLETVRQQSGGIVTLAELIPWMLQLCEVLEYLHGRTPPVVHRDLKPENVLLDEHGRVVLIDFGIAKESDQSQMTHTLARAASYGFSPPEQVLGTGTDQRSDVYALGATLYMLLTGTMPPPAHARVAGKEIRSPRTLNPRISPRLDAAIMRALELNINRRQQSIAEFSVELKAASESNESSEAAGIFGSPTIPTPTAPAPVKAQATGAAPVPSISLNSQATATPSPATRPHSRRRLIVSLLATAAAAAAVFIFVFLFPELGYRVISAFAPKDQRLVELAREHPLELQQVQLMATRGDGTAASAVKDAFTGSELEEAGYLTWTAVFKNNMAGIADVSQRVEARFLDPTGKPLAMGADARELLSKQNEASFHSTIMFPKLEARAGGQYRIEFFADNRKLGEYPFTILEAPNPKPSEEPSVPKQVSSVRINAPEHMRSPSHQRRHAPMEIRVRAIDERLLLTRNASVYLNPDDSSEAIREVHNGKYIHVTGIAGPYLRVSLRDGTVGFVPSDAAVTPSPVAGYQVPATPVAEQSPVQSQQNVQGNAIEQQLINSGMGIFSSAINKIR
jgi:eukaryotic-like serine/threonine-protein kinase